MSMSQEDIEALMNGLDIPADDSTDVSKEEPKDDEKINTKEIEELLSQVENQDNESIPVSSEKKINEIETLLNDIDEKSIDEQVQEVTKIKSNEVEDDKVKDEIVKEWSSSKINEGVFPFPAENDTKVVSQLSQVANDSEEKVSQIFDVLSLTLDNNGDLRKKIKEYEEFSLSQEKLLNSLASKFPNINVFQQQLGKVKEFENSLKGLRSMLDDEDMHIFQGMELMQFNDINRQKIERVMSVIRKLSIYLNNLFEEDNPKEIPMARHIHGDRDTEDLVGDDLDKLIAEFSN
ncbi:hypothetical protein [Aliarcobacter vitoriensis]|uniref:Chemotaxis protein CheZ n=1 Tax=Aliarcobacter vitoriensis TaxID=2011099 RepID=A0A366MU07_9BACT|nr:hypothetical protein [Aliarcobacter vitoriensis]RBQ29741.1 hypothetical protein CRU91_02070 [Aliarcobacter vitoriensis]RBQ31354.1 hypothetical protein CRU92_07825 [Arcobacter sp. FW59]